MSVSLIFSLKWPFHALNQCLLPHLLSIMEVGGGGADRESLLPSSQGSLQFPLSGRRIRMHLKMVDILLPPPYMDGEIKISFVKVR